jgi:benzylsuccinate CoA-transferase BbsF subunit/naphthyl-2-methylsuccinate CoA transferase subunit
VRPPLQGIRVVDIGVIWAIPYTAWLLASLGAEVIHIENPHHALSWDRLFRVWMTREKLKTMIDGANFPDQDQGERPWNRTCLFNSFFRNRRSCCINIGRKEGVDILKRLLMISDVFIENNGATVMENLGLGHEILMEMNPRLIVLNAPSWGRSGPYKDYVGYGDVGEALGGHAWLRGYPDEDHPVHNTTTFRFDDTTGPMAASAVIMGLMRRKRTGKGMWFDFAQIETVVTNMGEIFMDYAWNGRNQRTMGNRHQTDIQGTYRCRGEDVYGEARYLNITISTEEEWQAFSRAMGNPDWTVREEFSDPVKRRLNHDELDRYIESWTEKYDNIEAFHILQKYGVAAGPVLDPRDRFADAQLNAREYFQSLFQEDTGEYRYMGYPWKSSIPSWVPPRPPVRLGEHNDYVFEELLGMDDEEIARLEADNFLIGGDPTIFAGPKPEE